MKTLTDVSGDPDYVTQLRRLAGLEREEIIEVVPQQTNPPYTIDQAANDAFITMPELEQIIQLWQRKKNIVLQGPPGVGKTFIAKRLSYALMRYREPAPFRETTS